MLSKVSVLFLQEVWLSDCQMEELANIDYRPNYVFTGRSGFDNSEVLTGRPYGGAATLWRSDLAVSITVIDTNSKRVCAVRVVSDAFKLLFIITYENDDCSTTEFADPLIVIVILTLIAMLSLAVTSTLISREIDVTLHTTR